MSGFTRDTDGKEALHRASCWLRRGALVFLAVVLGDDADDKLLCDYNYCD
ncbi:MAG: hypothetical protein V2A73_09975 [Pseudomonadota bacterium]